VQRLSDVIDGLADHYHPWLNAEHDPSVVASHVDGPASQPQTGRDTNTGVDQMPPPSREQAAADAAEEIAAYALIRAWMADDADKGMLMIKQHDVPLRRPCL
jgi:hypothetical protein